MPELPEVETVARQLAPNIEGLKLKRLLIHDEKLMPLDPSQVEGMTVTSVSRIGKQIAFELQAHKSGGRTTGPRFLCVHLRMTGRLLWKPETKTNGLKHLRAELIFNGGRLLFQDVRRFGVIKLHETREEAEPNGIDPLSPELNTKRLHRMLSGSGQEIKAWLLRQDRLVGLGNIYASEILHVCGIHPGRRAGTLSYEETKLLFRHTRSILKKAIRHCGTTFSDFQDSRGSSGSFQQFLKVYQHEGEGCRNCGTLIKRLVQQQRSTFFCPLCQPD